MLRHATTPSVASIEEILETPANRRMIEAATRFSSGLNRLGYLTRTYSESALQKLLTTPLEKIEQISASFESWSEWIEPLDPNKAYENEIALLLRALNKHGFQADDEFLKTIEKDQIIEFYNEDMIQLYRSFNFYKITGYSLLDISLYEWFVLWERPRQILDGIASELAETLETYIPVKSFKTKRHLVREIFNACESKFFEPRASILTPVRLGSLKPQPFSSSKKKGFICTSTGEVVALGKEAENIQFI
jgi:hypothetical protein